MFISCLKKNTLDILKKQISKKKSTIAPRSDGFSEGAC
jgi:hypothetical protein